MSSPSSLASALIRKPSVSSTPAVRIEQQGCGGFWEGLCKLLAYIFGSSPPAQPLSNRIVIPLKLNVHEKFDWEKVKKNAEQRVQALKSDPEFPINRQAVRQADDQLKPLREKVKRLRKNVLDYEALVKRYQEQVDNYEMDEDDEDFVELREDHNVINEEYQAAIK